MQFEGKKIQSRRSKVLLNLDGPKDACPLCKLNMKIKYTVCTQIVLMLKSPFKVIADNNLNYLSS